MYNLEDRQLYLKRNRTLEHWGYFISNIKVQLKGFKDVIGVLGKLPPVEHPPSQVHAMESAILFSLVPVSLELISF